MCLIQKYHKEALEIAEKVRNEYVVEVEGTVIARDEGTINQNLNTGKIEVQAERHDDY